LDNVRSQSAELSDQALARLVRQFYAKAQHDPVLGPVFEPGVSDWEAHLERVAAFRGTAAVGTPGYHGDPMAAHATHALTAAMFDRWRRIWSETADEVFTANIAGELKGRASVIAGTLTAGPLANSPRAHSVAP
jgi:hemoglobin